MLVAKMNMGIAIPIVQIMTLVSFHATFYFKNFRWTPYIFFRPEDNKFNKANLEDNTVNKATSNNKPTNTSHIYMSNYFRQSESK